MRKLIVSSLVSLDGVYGDPQSWASDYFDDQAAEESLAVLLDSDAMLMGRRTYEYFAPAWSAPSAPAGPYLERINEIRKYVFSSTLEDESWDNSTIVRGDVAAETTKLKEQEGRDLLIWGHGLLAQTLLKQHLIDVLDISIYPVLAGHGKMFFREGHNGGLRLVTAKTFSKGIVKLTYEPTR